MILERDNFIAEEKNRLHLILNDYSKDMSVLINCFFFAARRGLVDILRIMLIENPEFSVRFINIFLYFLIYLCFLY